MSQRGGPVKVEFSQMFLEQLQRLPEDVRAEIMDMVDQMEAGEFDFSAAHPFGIDVVEEDDSI